MAKRSTFTALSRSVAVSLAITVALSVPASAAPVDQLTFGTQMAQRGLWSEALFRFRQAQEADPDNPRILNNVAVALEALGLYDQALDAYREAVETGPGLEAARRNYARFVEFYQAYRGGDVDDSDEQTAQGGDDAATESTVEEASEDESPSTDGVEPGAEV